jgi:hypothetical protein
LPKRTKIKIETGTMGNPYLNRDETIILTTQRIRINSTLIDVMLTNQRLILVDSSHAEFRPQTIPLTTIETVMIGEDADGNPVISLSLSALTPQGATQSKELIFSQKASGERKQERDEWVKQLKEQIASVREQALSIKIISPDRESAIQPDEIKPDRIARYPVDSPFKGNNYPSKGHGVPSEPEDSTKDSKIEFVSQEKVIPIITEVTEYEAMAGKAEQKSATLASRFHPPAPPPARSKTIVITAIVIIILAIIGAGVIYSTSLQGNSGTPPEPVNTPTIPPVATTIPPPTVQQTVTPQATIILPTQPEVLIPPTGVWVRVIYSGNFTGSIGSAGKMRPVNSSGDKFYQIPTVDGIVQALIQKLDASGKILTAEVYRNGTMVKNVSITAPRGTIDLVVDLKRV